MSINFYITNKLMSNNIMSLSYKQYDKLVRGTNPKKSLYQRFLDQNNFSSLCVIIDFNQEINNCINIPDNVLYLYIKPIIPPKQEEFKTFTITIYGPIVHTMIIYCDDVISYPTSNKSIMNDYLNVCHCTASIHENNIIMKFALLTYLIPSICKIRIESDKISDKNDIGDKTD